MSETAEQHRLLRAELERARQRERSTLTLGERVDKALVAAAGISGAPIASLDHRVSSGKPGSSPPPNSDEMLFGPEGGSVLDVYGRRLRLLLESMEREIDAHLVRPSTDARETREEKDKRLVRDFEGDPPHLVSFLDPTLGSPRTIERARIRMQRNPGDGRENG